MKSKNIISAYQGGLAIESAQGDKSRANTLMGLKTCEAKTLK